MTERKRNNQADPRPLWQKLGGGTMKLKNNYRVKPNEQFRAYEDQIPYGSIDKVKKLSKGELEEENDKQLEVETVSGDEFYVEHRSGPWYDVKSPVGQVMNDRAMKQDEADTLKKQLNGEE